MEDTTIPDVERRSPIRPLPQARPLRVLLVAPDAERAANVSRALEKADAPGFEVRHVEDAEPAVSALARGDHDAALVDLPACGEDALEVLSRLTATAPALPVVALVGDDRALGAHALRLGAEDWLPPLGDDPELLIRSLRHAVERQRLVQKLRFVSEREHFLSTRDVLTGLPNRNQLQDYLHTALAQAERREARCAVMVVGLDRFKNINDSLGPELGDRLLRKTAVRIVRSLREADFKARLGGDEFCVVLPQIERDYEPGKVAERILKNLSPPHMIAGHEYWATASVGIACFPRDGANSDALLRNAETAVHRAKEGGGNDYRFYDAPMNEAVVRKLTMERKVRRAFENDVFELHYQPKLDLATGAIVGCEGLLRWTDPELGYVPPLDFIPVAEESGLMGKIGAWCLREACTRTKIWHDAGFPELRVSVNVSAHQVREDVLRELVVKTLWDTGLAPESLELEITENALMHEDNVDVLQELKRIGVGVSLDDFGTGFSSLSHLKGIPVDTVKIDQSFVRDLLLDPDDATIVEATLSIADKLGLTVVAEGVETQAQRDFLAERGCHQMQGFLFSPAVPADEFLDMLRRNRKS